MPGRQLFVDPYTGAVLGEGNGQSVRDFFRVIVEWHRYLGASGASRPRGRAVTGASNLAFLFIVRERHLSLVAALVDLDVAAQHHAGSEAGCAARRAISTGTTRLDSGLRFRWRSSCMRRGRHLLSVGDSARVPRLRRSAAGACRRRAAARERCDRGLPAHRIDGRCHSRR